MDEHADYMYKILVIIFRLREIKYQIAIHSCRLGFISKELSTYIKYNTLKKTL